jgi:nickel-dependent lactate racemase
MMASAKLSFVLAAETAKMARALDGITGAIFYSRITNELAPGGTIVLVASLTEGLGSPEFQQLMKENQDLPKFIKRILETDYFVMDQWQLEELCKVLSKCKVKVVTHGLSAETLRQCQVEPAESVEKAVADALAEHGPSAKLAVIPKGPYVLPYVMGV